jgi:hypothetical protein
MRVNFGDESIDCESFFSLYTLTMPRRVVVVKTDSREGPFLMLPVVSWSFKSQEQLRAVV